MSLFYVYFNILVYVTLQPEDQVGLLGSTVQMFCHANISDFTWTAIHLDFKNSTSSQRLISVLHNETIDNIGNLINASIISNDALMNISYVFNISDEAIVCSMDGEYSCDIEFTDNVIQTTNNKGNLSVTGIRYIFHIYFFVIQSLIKAVRKDLTTSN